MEYGIIDIRYLLLLMCLKVLTKFLYPEIDSNFCVLMQIVALGGEKKSMTIQFGVYAD